MGSEVANEVGLVGVAQFEGERRPTGFAASGQAFGDLVQPVSRITHLGGTPIRSARARCGARTLTPNRSASAATVATTWASSRIAAMAAWAMT